jgi:N-acetylmuramic acid 6-phosphate etherase
MKLTEKTSFYNNIDQMEMEEILFSMNKEDKKVALEVEKCLPQIEKLASAISRKINAGGRLFYIGAGTSGRLGILDASECPPTFGVEQGLVIGLIAGGDSAIRKAVEFAEDNTDLGWHDLQKFNISTKDIVVGIAASGSTPYVIGAIKECKNNFIQTGCITCNSSSELAALVDFPVEVLVGPEFITGSTRLKSGTAQKLVLNMLSTSAMIKFGRVKGNKMVDMQMANNKLIDRGVKMIMDELNIDYKVAKELLELHGTVRNAIDSKK